jgi:hypothetical protein
MTSNRYKSAGEVKQRHISALPASIGSVFAELHNQLSAAHVVRKLVKQIYGGNTDAHAVQRSTAPDFFAVTSFVFRDWVLLSIARCLDSVTTGSHKNLTFEALVRGVETHGDGELARELGCRLDTLRKFVEPVRDHRNKRLAHLDLATLLEGEGGQPSVEYGALIDKALSEMSAFMNLVSQRYIQTEIRYDLPILRGDGDDLIFWLKRALDADEEERRRLLDALKKGRE